MGSGSGWPGLYIARRLGCDTVLVDIPLQALKIAVSRARREHLNGRLRACIADAANLPFDTEIFDAISHSDVLCCLSQKHEALMSCRRVIRPSGRMVFTVVSLSENLSDEDKACAIKTSPEFVESLSSYDELLDQTGWRILKYLDLTQEFYERCRQLLKYDKEMKEQLIAAIGQSGYDERQTDWQSRLLAISAGLIQRKLYVVAPAG